MPFGADALDELAAIFFAPVELRGFALRRSLIFRVVREAVPPEIMQLERALTFLEVRWSGVS